MAAKYQTPIFLIGSASAEVIADIALCPWEAVKVRAWLCACEILLIPLSKCQIASVIWTLLRRAGCMLL